MSFKTLAILSSILSIVASATPVCPERDAYGASYVQDNTLPVAISANGLREIQLAQFIEQLEVSFFTQGLENITNWGTEGFPNDTIDIIDAITTQEKIHLQSLIALLDHFGAPIIPACNYSFPVTSTDEFLQLAHLISSVGISATIGLSDRLAASDPALVGLVSSVLAVESRHDAFFRHVRGQTPTPAPFETGTSEFWAYNAALALTVPGSCLFGIPLPIIPSLEVSPSFQSTPSNGTNSTSVMWCEFTWDPAQMSFVVNQGKELLVGWINQVNIPVYTSMNITEKGKGTATVPQGLNGLVFAAITTERYGNPDDLAWGAMAGPAVLSVS